MWNEGSKKPALMAPTDNSSVYVTLKLEELGRTIFLRLLLKIRMILSLCLEQWSVPTAGLLHGLILPSLSPILALQSLELQKRILTVW